MARDPLSTSSDDSLALRVLDIFRRRMLLAVAVFAMVLGAVRMPGHYEVKSSATVLELIARAQGLTEFADRGRIVVMRQSGNETTRIPFNYRKVAEGSEQDNFYVRPGDIIVVP